MLKRATDAACCPHTASKPSSAAPEHSTLTRQSSKHMPVHNQVAIRRNPKTYANRTRVTPSDACRQPLQASARLAVCVCVCACVHWIAVPHNKRRPMSRVCRHYMLVLHRTGQGSSVSPV